MTSGRPLHLTMLFLFYFGVREDAVATAKEGLEVKREALLAGFWSLNCPVGVAVFIFTLNVPANSCMEDGNFNPRIHDLLYSNFSLHFAKVSSLSITLKEKKNFLRLYS